MPTQMSGDDAEKGTVGLGITTSASASTSSSPAHVTSAPSPLRSLFSVGHVSLRRRRLLGMVVFTLGVITLGGWWSESIPDLRGILFGSESPGKSSTLLNVPGGWFVCPEAHYSFAVRYWVTS